MLRRIACIGVMGLGIAVAAACHDTTAPPVYRIATISKIHVSGHALPTEPVFVNFVYYTIAACDTGTVEVRQSYNEVRFTAISYPVRGPCTANTSIERPWNYFVQPYHGAPMQVVFTQPSGGDSVRVVAP